MNAAQPPATQKRLATNAQHIDERLEADRQLLFLHNELVFTHLIPEEDFWEELGARHAPALPTAEAGFLNAFTTSYAETADWAIRKRQLFSEYPSIEHKFAHESAREDFSERTFFERFFDSRYFKTDTKVPNEQFQEVFRADSLGKEEIRERVRGGFYDEFVAARPLMNDGWEGVGTKGIPWTEEMMACRMDDAAGVIDRMNWHCETVVRSMAGTYRAYDAAAEARLSYAPVETERITAVADPSYTGWTLERVPAEPVCISMDVDERWTESFQGGDDVAKSPSDPPRVPHSEQIACLMRFSVLCSFSLRAFWKAKGEKRAKFRDVLEMCLEKANELSKKGNDECYLAIIRQIIKQLQFAMQ